MFNTKSFLSHVFLFEALSEKELEELTFFCSPKKILKDELLFSKGQIVDSFYIVAYGKIKIFRLSPNGDENLIHIQREGDLIAEAAIFDDERYPANAQALEESLLVKISADHFKNILKTNPHLCFKIMSAYAKRLRLFAKKIQDLSLNDIKGRLANFLLTESEKNIVTLSMSKKDLASSLGTIPETLSRTLLFFKKNNLIEEVDGKIIIKKSQELKDFIN